MYRWQYRVFELLNGIQSLLGSGVEITPSGDITATDLQSAIEQTGALIPGHTTAADPHSVYQKESEKGVANGYAELDGDATVPDAQIPAAIARDTEVTAEITAAVDAHVAAADPHTGYQKESEKDGASGYAGLNASSRATKGIDTTDDLIVDLATKGLVLKDTQGTPHYWRVTVTTLGALSTADLGTSKP
jgi:hypothetical protein